LAEWGSVSYKEPVYFQAIGVLLDPADAELTEALNLSSLLLDRSRKVAPSPILSEEEHLRVLRTSPMLASPE